MLNGTDEFTVYEQADEIIAKHLEPMLKDCSDEVYKVMPVTLVHAGMLGMMDQGWSDEEILKQVAAIIAAYRRKGER